MFHWNNGLVLTKAGLAVDIPRRQACAFVSHAHADHIGRHQFALCTPQTAALYQLRLGKRSVKPMEYREPLEWGGLRLTAFPAGHCLGSAMLLAEDGDDSVLYTGDFKLGPSATSEQAEFPHARRLIIESTYGDPSYRLPPREESVAAFLETVADILRSGRTPVVQAYVLGKSQEVTKLLGDAGFRVLQHSNIVPITRIYETFGVDFGDWGVFEEEAAPGDVLVVPPRTRVNGVANPVLISVTGWAAMRGAKYRFRVDHAIPLSDHADYDDLIEAVRMVDPEVVYCTHGPKSFVAILLDLGFDARPLG